MSVGGGGRRCANGSAASPSPSGPDLEELRPHWLPAAEAAFDGLRCVTLKLILKYFGFSRINNHLCCLFSAEMVAWFYVFAVLAGSPCFFLASDGWMEAFPVLLQRP